MLGRAVMEPERWRRMEPYTAFSVTLFLPPVTPVVPAPPEAAVPTATELFLSRAPTVGRIFLFSNCSLLLTRRMDLRAAVPAVMPVPTVAAVVTPPPELGGVWRRRVEVEGATE